MFHLCLWEHNLPAAKIHTNLPFFCTRLCFIKTGGGFHLLNIGSFIGIDNGDNVRFGNFYEYSILHLKKMEYLYIIDMKFILFYMSCLTKG